jgi:hypothetical protein
MKKMPLRQHLSIDVVAPAYQFFQIEDRWHLAKMDGNICNKSDHGITQIKPLTIHTDLRFYNSNWNLSYGKEDPIFNQIHLSS